MSKALLVMCSHYADKSFEYQGSILYYSDMQLIYTESFLCMYNLPM